VKKNTAARALRCGEDVVFPSTVSKKKRPPSGPCSFVSRLERNPNSHHCRLDNETRCPTPPADNFLQRAKSACRPLSPRRCGTLLALARAPLVPREATGGPGKPLHSPAQTRTFLSSGRHGFYGALGSSDWRRFPCWRGSSLAGETSSLSAPSSSLGRSDRFTQPE